MQDCVELCLGEKKDQREHREHKMLVETPTDAAEKEESTFPEQESAQDDEFQNTPVENDDEPMNTSTGSVGLTENGNFVGQESGKAAVLSRQESQSQSTFT